jgi:hypothetical protein
MSASEGDDLGRAIPDAAGDFDPVAARHETPRGTAQSLHAVWPIGEDLVSVGEDDSDSLTGGLELVSRYVPGIVLEDTGLPIADQHRFAARIGHVSMLPY